MASIFPFAALRPVPSAAAAVAAVPYDVVNTDEARALASGNPLSFLHVSRAEIDLPPGTDPYADEVYERAAENFRDLRARAPLVVEDDTGFYVYRLRWDAHVQSGIAACFSLDEYDHDLIKKHEKTRPDKEDDRTRHMLAIGAQTGPVFLTYAASAAIDAVVSASRERAALFDFAAPDGVRHAIWTVRPGPRGGRVAASRDSALYIADGHHRAASAARARRALAGRGPGEHDRVLAVAFPDNQMQILPYNRVVKDLNGLTGAVCRSARHADGHRRFAARRRARRMRRCMSPDVVRTRLARSGQKMIARRRSTSACCRTPCSRRCSALQDVRTDKRIDFVGGIRGTRELERLVDSGEFAVAFSLYPVSVSDLMHIADAGGIMPPKSTWFEPKLRDGLLSHLI